MNRKKVSESEQTPSAKLQEKPSAPAAGSPIKKHIRRVEEFDEYVQPDTNKATAPINIPAREVLEEEEEYIDPIEELLAQIDEEHQFILRVDKLPDYAKTGRALGKGVAVEYCDEFPFDPDYMKLVQRFGAGTYRLTLKNSSHRFQKQWKVHVANPVMHPAAPHTSAATSQPITYPQPNAQQPLDPVAPLSQLADVAKHLRAIRRDMGWEQEPQQVKEPVRVPELAEKPLEERVLEKLLGLAEKNEPLADRLLSRYLGEEKQESGWKEIIAEIAKPFVPAIAQLMMNQMRAQQIASGQAVAPAQQLPAPQLMQPPVAAPPGVTDQALQAIDGSQPLNGQHVQPNEEEDEHMDLIDILVDLLNECVNKAVADPTAIEAGYREVRAFSSRNPMIAAFVKGLAAGTPEMVLGVLVGAYPDLIMLQGNSVALETIAALQAKLRGQ